MKWGVTCATGIVKYSSCKQVIQYSGPTSLCSLTSHFDELAPGRNTVIHLCAPLSIYEQMFGFIKIVCFQLALFKLATLTYRCLHCRAHPPLPVRWTKLSLIFLLVGAFAQPPPTLLRPIRPMRLVTVGDRAFPFAAAKLWNELHSDVTASVFLTAFRRRVKTCLFRISIAAFALTLIDHAVLTLLFGIPPSSSSYLHRPVGVTLNCIHIFIVTGSFLYPCVMRPSSRVCSYTVVFIYESWSYLIQQRFLALIAFLCWCAAKQSINQSSYLQIQFRNSPFLWCKLFWPITILSTCFWFDTIMLIFASKNYTMLCYVTFFTIF